MEPRLNEPCEKKVNRSRCSLGFGLGWVQGNMYYLGGAHRRHIANTIWPPICAAMRPVVKFLWPLLHISYHMYLVQLLEMTHWIFIKSFGVRIP